MGPGHPRVLGGVPGGSGANVQGPRSLASGGARQGGVQRSGARGGGARRGGARRGAEGRGGARQGGVKQGGAWRGGAGYNRAGHGGAGRGGAGPERTRSRGRPGPCGSASSRTPSPPPRVCSCWSAGANPSPTGSYGPSLRRRRPRRAPPRVSSALNLEQPPTAGPPVRSRGPGTRFLLPQSPTCPIHPPNACALGAQCALVRARL